MTDFIIQKQNLIKLNNARMQKIIKEPEPNHFYSRIV